ncbi:hypothetical protein FRB99_002886 [Tulasnella sp. 403]|nr:hypothetical protein FRB99_002886 [Tulasnella sp. 403]
MRGVDRPPLRNPYETFTSGDFDSFVAGIRAKVSGALNPPQRPKTSPPASPRRADQRKEPSPGYLSRLFKKGRSPSASPAKTEPEVDADQVEEDELDTDVPEEPTAFMAVSNKGKGRAPDEGPGLQGLQAIAAGEVLDEPMYDEDAGEHPNETYEEEVGEEDLNYPPEYTEKYRQYYSRTVVEDADGEGSEDSEEQEGDELGERQAEPLAEEYDECYDDEEREESIGHTGVGKDYRMDTDGAIVIDSDEEDELAPGATHHPARKSPGWDGVAGDDAMDHSPGSPSGDVDEPEETVHQETRPGQLDVYDQDQEVDELDDEEQDLVYNEEELRGTAVFGSEAQDVYPLAESVEPVSEEFADQPDDGPEGVDNSPWPADPVTTTPRSSPPPLMFEQPVLSTMPIESQPLLPQDLSNENARSVFQYDTSNFDLGAASMIGPQVDQALNDVLMRIQAGNIPFDMPSSGGAIYPPAAFYPGLQSVAYETSYPAIAIPTSDSIPNSLPSVNTANGPVPGAPPSVPGDAGEPLPMIPAPTVITQAGGYLHYIDASHQATAIDQDAESGYLASSTEYLANGVIPFPISTQFGDLSVPSHISTPDPHLGENGALPAILEELASAGDANASLREMQDLAHASAGTIDLTGDEEEDELADVTTRDGSALVQTIAEETKVFTVVGHIVDNAGNDLQEMADNVVERGLGTKNSSPSGSNKLFVDDELDAEIDMPQAALPANEMERERDGQKEPQEEVLGLNLMRESSPAPTTNQLGPPTAHLVPPMSPEPREATTPLSDVNRDTAVPDNGLDGTLDEPELTNHLGADRGDATELLNGGDVSLPVDDSYEASINDDVSSALSELPDDEQFGDPSIDADGQNTSKPLDADHASLCQSMTNEVHGERKSVEPILVGEERDVSLPELNGNSNAKSPLISEADLSAPPTTANPDTDSSHGVATAVHQAEEMPTQHPDPPPPPPLPPVMRTHTLNVYRHHHGPIPKRPPVIEPRPATQVEVKEPAQDGRSRSSSPSPPPSLDSESLLPNGESRNPDAPVTRSHCRFRKIAIPFPISEPESAEDTETERPPEENVAGPSSHPQARQQKSRLGMVHFIVPACALSAVDVLKTEHIEDLGEATRLENESKIPEFAAAEIEPAVIVALRKLGGPHFDLDPACAWLPSDEERTRFYHFLEERRKEAAAAAASQSSISAYSRRKSLAGSSRTRDSLAGSSSLRGSLSKKRKDHGGRASQSWSRNDTKDSMEVDAILNESDGDTNMDDGDERPTTPNLQPSSSTDDLSVPQDESENEVDDVVADPTAKTHSEATAKRRRTARGKQGHKISEDSRAWHPPQEENETEDEIDERPTKKAKRSARRRSVTPVPASQRASSPIPSLPTQTNRSSKISKGMKKRVRTNDTIDERRQDEFKKPLKKARSRKHDIGESASVASAEDDLRSVTSGSSQSRRSVLEVVVDRPTKALRRNHQHNSTPPSSISTETSPHKGSDKPVSESSQRSQSSQRSSLRLQSLRNKSQAH